MFRIPGISEMGNDISHGRGNDIDGSGGQSEKVIIIRYYVEIVNTDFEKISKNLKESQRKI